MGKAGVIKIQSVGYRSITTYFQIVLDLDAAWPQVFVWEVILLDAIEVRVWRQVYRA